MRTKTKIKIQKRVLIILAAVTVVALIHMIWVRVSAVGYNLITMDSRAGWHVATMYNAAVVIFVIFAVLLGSWLCVNFVKNRKKSDKYKK